ncbi:hypothetical protein [Leptospira kanakyensis]|uniref:hypothetical protein n=1 Tax=Leptospira kanakyensis TaxID=2484968 RepID=UPI00223DED35|nr:hypothetical protein [Leptospira kanakyensis]MCW7483283.1 hypothetical protein [Leptospira kanakyensis]
MNLIHTINGLNYQRISTSEESKIISEIENNFNFDGYKINYSKSSYFKEYETMSELKKDSLVLESWNSIYYYFHLICKTETDFPFSAKLADLYDYIDPIVTNSNIEHFFYSPQFSILIEPSLFPFETRVTKGFHSV